MAQANTDSTENIRSKSPEELVGFRLRELRTSKGFSLRALANQSGLNVNTLSMIENGKTSPSVSTLQQLARGMQIPISEFFKSEINAKQVIYTPLQQRPLVVLGNIVMQSLGKDFRGDKVQPFIVTLEPGMGSGERTLVHTGYEFVYCLAGSLQYQIIDKDYKLNVGDSLLFEAHLPHRWNNYGEVTTQAMIILYPIDEAEELGVRHFTINYTNMEKTMKIAVITDDGETISQHFGRAAFYAVLTVENGTIVDRELRSKIGHNNFQNQTHSKESEGSQGQGHGKDALSHNKHLSMAETISDCKALICGGMGMGAYESLQKLNIQPVVTDLKEIDTAVQLFVDGTLVDRTELLH